jgi:hypothetical protein
MAIKLESCLFICILVSVTIATSEMVTLPMPTNAFIRSYIESYTLAIHRYARARARARAQQRRAFVVGLGMNAANRGASLVGVYQFANVSFLIYFAIESALLFNAASRSYFYLTLAQFLLLAHTMFRANNL